MFEKSILYMKFGIHLVINNEVRISTSANRYVKAILTGILAMGQNPCSNLGERLIKVIHIRNLEATG